MPYQNTEPGQNDTEPVLLAKILQVLNDIAKSLASIDQKTP